MAENHDLIDFCTLGMFIIGIDITHFILPILTTKMKLNSPHQNPQSKTSSAVLAPTQRWEPASSLRRQSQRAWAGSWIAGLTFRLSFGNSSRNGIRAS
jgi:hypothetical protein